MCFPGLGMRGLKFYWELHKNATVILETLVMSLDLEEGDQELVRTLTQGTIISCRYFIIHPWEWRDYRINTQVAWARI
jgi:hypothetical protein